jgi:hypothetical protein
MACHIRLGKNYTKSLCDSDHDDDGSTDCEKSSSDADTANHMVGRSFASDQRDANIDPLISEVTDRPHAADDDDTLLISMASQIDDIDISQDLKYFHDFLSMSFEFVDDDERRSMEGAAAVDCTQVGGFIGGLWPCCFIGAPTDETAVAK